MKKLEKIVIFQIVFLFTSGLVATVLPGNMTSRFDHKFHERKVFKDKKISCSHCHRFSETTPGQVTLSKGAVNSIFSRPQKQICHECHVDKRKLYPSAPSKCFTCHQNLDDIKLIKPKNHDGITWKRAHSTNARVNSEDCLNCHQTSQCVKCHMHRDDIEMTNHGRNFRFTHSIEARAQPHRCDTCHTKSFCKNCHLGIKK